MTEQTCKCGVATTLIFACSGAADVGALTDLAARQLSREHIGRMYCLAGIGGRIADILRTTTEARSVLAIDGCPAACASACLQQAGLSGFARLQLADLGLPKGHAPATPENIERVVTAAKTLIPADPIAGETP
ncbi:putative zinc-binding protein [Uliginosibacterium flavum]|uniref:Zinc-binding protein n=1 Tax=Uliginosibacterium flavum TaxID=1396831 RepID=A0ABV2TQU7_9RHOO